MRPIAFFTIFCGVLVVLPRWAGATAQVPDQLHYKGKKHDLFSTPLEGYFSDANPRPKSLQMESTACWRGYSAVWEIRDGWLQLRGLEHCHSWERKDKTLQVESVLPGKKLPLRASWFTGVLRVPQGKQLRYVHLGFHSVYEKDLLLWIRKGRLFAERVVDNRPGKKTRASKPRPEREIAAGLAPAAAFIKKSCKSRSAGKKDNVVLLKMVVTAHGAPDQVEIVDKLPVEVSACIEAAVMLMARFPVADGADEVQHWLKLR